MVAAIETLLTLQKEAISELQGRIANHQKTGLAGRTQSYYERRIIRLDDWWQSFERRNADIEKTARETDTDISSQQYVTNNSYASAKNLFDNHRAALREELAAIVGEDYEDESIDVTPKTNQTDNPNGNNQNGTPPTNDDQSGPSRATLSSLGAVVQLLYEDFTNLTNEIGGMTGTESAGRAKAELDVLRESWASFKSKYYEARTLGSCFNFNMHRLQSEYAMAMGRLNDMISPKSTANSGQIIQLPKIKLPEFSGKHEEWRTYIELFDKIVHNNGNINDAIKMQYLKTSLSGEAAKLVSNLAPTGENYSTCYEILNKRYNNKRELFGALIDAIIDLPKCKYENSDDIRKLHDTVNENILAIKNLGFDTTTWDPIVSHILLRKLSKDTIKHYECQLSDIRETQTLQEFLIYLETRFLALQSAESKSGGNLSSNQFNQNNANNSKSYAVSSDRKETQIKCPNCGENHFMSKCPKFLQKGVSDRISLIKSKNLCNNCFGNHKYVECKSKFTCKTCKKKHHSLLHIESVKSNVVKTSAEKPDKTNDNESTDETVHQTSNFVSSLDRTVLLATALVGVRAQSGEIIALRALIDQGSQSCFISVGALQLLKLQRIPKLHHISGIGERGAVSDSVVDLSICPRFTSQFELKVQAIVLKKLAKMTNRATKCSRTFKHIEHLLLADPSFTEHSRIDLILGAVEYAQIIKSGLIKGSIDEPIAQNSELGWIISGPISDCNNNNNVRIVAMISNVELNKKLDQFFSSDDVKDFDNKHTEEEEFCENHFVLTHKRNERGQYVVQIPFKNGSNYPDLGESRKCAIATLFSLEKKFMSNADLACEYKKFINEYIDLGHMEETEYDPTLPNYYMPHHHVLKDSTTTKLRVVFNASQKSQNGKSLNDQMAMGALEQNDILSILIHFRIFEFAFTADVEKMYRQILIDDEQANFQRIVWRESPNEPIRDYKLKTVTYGTANAPYLAIRTIRQLATDSIHEYPETSNLILDCMYVDDVVAGGFTKDQAIRHYKELKTIFGSANFNLRKWSTNCAELSAVIPSQDLEMKAFSSHIKTLGIVWSPISDNFSFEIKLPDGQNQLTKRILLSEISSIFDPLGWISPIVIAGRHLMQLIWKESLDWDDRVPDVISRNWLKIRGEIDVINKIHIPRWIGYNPNQKFELHGFCDASEIAYAAVIYVKNIALNKVSLLSAKTRVAPLKNSKDQLTIPKLELCGAALLAKLVKKSLHSLNIEFDKIYLWCDSKIAIDWIRGNPKRFKTFVANKICFINKCVGSENWHHVSSENNPADYASRGQSPAQLIENSVWWNGPDFLYQAEYPKFCNETKNSLTFETIAFNAFIDEKEHIPTQYLPNMSSFYTMCRVIAYCLRWKNKNTGSLTSAEIKNAELSIIRHIQQECFLPEIKMLRKNKSVKNSSHLLKLSPFLDDKGLIRVGGRLGNAKISYNAKHPILLPKNHNVTSLIIKHFHFQCLHGGARCTEATLRQRYWVINSQSQIKSVIGKCIVCFKHKKNTMTQMMAQLPHSRVSMLEKPFSNVAVDYTGAINYKFSKGRGAKTSKAYVCIFVCMATKAVHIELVSDMTAEAFIAAFRRLIARRGMVQNLYSDNGTYFVKANKNLLSMTEREAEEYDAKICNELTKRGTHWHFSPAGAPHFNGLAEAAVKIIKNHLCKMMGSTALTFEELATLLYQIESCANSRPLCALSTDANDLSCLTPGHFLVGTSLLSVPDENCLETNVNWLNRWQLLQKMTQSFWKRFQTEYLHQLQVKAKWHNHESQPRVDDLVLVKEENCPPCSWPMAKIIKIHPGNDDIARVVTLKMRNIITTRPITKLAPLPTNDQNDDTAVDDATIHAHVSQIRRGKSYNALPIITAFLAICVSLSNPLPMTNSNPFSIINFDSPPGLYFEQLANAHMTYTNWKTIVYVDLNAITDNKNALIENFDHSKTLCFTKLFARGPCSSLVNLMEAKITQIDEKHQLLLTAKERVRRAVLGIIGDLAGDLFGILGEKFANDYANDIKKFAANDEHIMKLLRNHTSILDSTINLIKENINNANDRLNFVKAVANEVNATADISHANIQFQTISAHFLQSTMEYEADLDALLDVLFDAGNGHVNFRLIKPNQMKKQALLISDQLTEKLVVPEIDDLYKVTKIQPIIIKNTLFFRVLIPLINPERHHVYKIIPVPYRINEHFLQIRTSNSFLLTSVHRDRYQFSDVNELTRCKHLSKGSILCESPRQWFSDKRKSCEWNLFSHSSDEYCITEKFNLNIWVELDEKNKWLFSFQNPERVIAICNNVVSHHDLNNSGILDLNPSCTLQTQLDKIVSQHDLENTSNEFVFPQFRVNDTQAVEFKNELRTLDYFHANLSGLHERLDAVKSQLELPERVDSHHVHHYAMLYALVISMVVIFIIIFNYGARIRSLAALPLREAVQPAPRQISMPNLVLAGENVAQQQ